MKIWAFSLFLSLSLFQNGSILSRCFCNEYVGHAQPTTALNDDIISQRFFIRIRSHNPIGPNWTKILRPEMFHLLRL